MRKIFLLVALVLAACSRTTVMPYGWEAPLDASGEPSAEYEIVSAPAEVGALTVNLYAVMWTEDGAVSAFEITNDGTEPFSFDQKVNVTSITDGQRMTAKPCTGGSTKFDVQPGQTVKAFLCWAGQRGDIQVTFQNGSKVLAWQLPKGSVGGAQ